MTSGGTLHGRRCGLIGEHEAPNVALSLALCPVQGLRELPGPLRAVAPVSLLRGQHQGSLSPLGLSQLVQGSSQRTLCCRGESCDWACFLTSSQEQELCPGLYG